MFKINCGNYCACTQAHSPCLAHNMHIVLDKIRSAIFHYIAYKTVSCFVSKTMKQLGVELKKYAILQDVLLDMTKSQKVSTIDKSNDLLTSTAAAPCRQRGRSLFQTEA